jgi:uncharacterized protein (TIGR02611 family)
MSPGVEDRSRPHTDTEAPRTAASEAALGNDQGQIATQNGNQANRAGIWSDSDHPVRKLTSEHGEHAEHHHHHVLIEPEEDRWRWRRRIRENPRHLAVYRVAVGFLGLLLICLGFVSGPLPGPGGIPLILAGLAVWASEFDWANDLMHWFKAQLRKYRTLTPNRKIAVWVIFFACCLLVGYGYLLVLGTPGWLPDSLTRALGLLPLID